MIKYLKRLQEVVDVHPDRIAVVDLDGRRKTTYRELYDKALRVNAWLSSHKIGREDAVAIYYPKGLEYIATRIGIMMSGAAWVGLEDFMGKERIDFVIEDCECKVIFNMERWEEAMKCAPLEQFAEPDSHDLAFYIYTSGSTGNPKGAAQEYGVYDYTLEGTFAFFSYAAYPNGRDGELIPLQFAHVIPETFVGGVYITMGIPNVEGTIHVISMELTRKPDELVRYFIENKIDTTFMTPTFISALQKVPGLSLRYGFTGGEIVSNLYSEKMGLINIYGPSEFGYPACVFRLDRAYENTPIGTVTHDESIILLDDEGKESDEGVLCVHLPFFRGYRNLPEENKSSQISINGKKYFKSSDYARKDRQGRYTIIGRVDEMVKINGNRVEPGEVEAVIKRHFDIEFCTVMAVRVNGINVLAAYYTDRKMPGAEAIMQSLRDLLPNYMIPSYYIQIDDIPLNTVGKIDKKALPIPEVNEYVGEYAAPENDIEKVLCVVFSKVLGTGRKVGISDDFFLLGGDSILAMNCIYNAGLKHLSMQMIYEGRTPGQIAKLVEEAQKADESVNESPDEVLEAPLNFEQLCLLDYEFKFPGTTMLNLPYKFSLKMSADPKVVARAISLAVKAHPALLSVIEKRGDDYILKYRPDFDWEISVETVSDEEFDEIEESFVRPFSLDGEPLYRCRVLESPTRKAVFYDAYHAICDGYSYNYMTEEVGRFLDNEAMSTDYFFSILKEEKSRKGLLRREKDNHYFENRYDKPGYSTLPLKDHDTDENLDEGIVMEFTHKRDIVRRVARQYGLGKNGFYIAALLLTLARYNKTDKVMIQWLWNGRDDRRSAGSVGVFIKDLPVAAEFTDEMTVGELLIDIGLQIREGIKHGSVPYFMEKGGYCGEDLISLIYQGDLYNYPKDDYVYSFEKMENEGFACENAMDVEIFDDRDNYAVFLDFNGAVFEKENMEKFAKIFLKMCNELTEGDIFAKSVKKLI